MKNDNLKQLKKYFSNFCSKNIEELKNIFSDNIELKDWNNQFFGKKEVLNEVESIFNSFNTIELNIISIYNFVDIVNCEDGEYMLSIPSDNKFACQLEILFDEEPPLRVIDLIEFDNVGKIKTLIAYKR